MKKHVIEQLKAQGMSEPVAAGAFKAVCEAIDKVLERGERVRIDNVGTLVRKTRAETRRRNPRTKEAITIAAYDVVALRNPRRY